jgi:phage head maturation protease
VRGSFGCATRQDRWTRDGALLVRELLDIERREISLVTMPAYATTDVTVAPWALAVAAAPPPGRSVAWLHRH